LKNSDLSPEELRKQVTSPGGTTESALAVLNGEPGLQKLVMNAVKAAMERSKQLS